jgi:cyclase
MKLRSSVAAVSLVALMLPIVAVGQDLIRTATPSVRGLTEADFPRVKEIVPDVYVYEALTGPPDDRYTTNSMFVVTEGGVLVADGQGNLKETARLVTAIAEITVQPITHVVICSDHGDHTNGNRSFPDGVQFIAQKNSLPALERAATDGGVMPDTIVDDRLDLQLGERDIQILFLGRAHTGGDLFVWLPDEKILFTTEVFLNHMFSGYRSAFAREWLVAMDAAEELEADITIPGHGFVDSPEILKEEWFEYKKHLQVVLDEVTRLHKSGLSVDEAINRADFGPYNDWSGADSQGPVGIRRIYAELNGEIE